MDFFNSLTQVAKNNKNFKKWEEQQSDTQAQREELYKRRKYSEAEIEHARQLGDRIIDVVDIMDNHSENVAENVETAVEPIVGLAPLIPTIPAAVYYFKKVLKPAGEAIAKIEEKTLGENEKARALAEEITNEIHKTRPHKIGFYYWDFTSKRAIDKIPNANLKAKAMELHKEYTKQAKPYLKKMKGGAFGVVALSIASFIGANIYAAKLQVDSSKIARYQARKLLEDPKAFVNYTPEQIEAAKKYIEDHPELKKENKKEKLKSGMVKSIINILKDRKAYLNAKKNDTDESKKVARTLSPEELIQAKKDKEVIQRSVRIINNEAEKYSENMEVAAGIILGSTPIVGGAIGWLTGILMNKTGLTDKIVSNIVNKTGTEEAKAAYQRFKELKAGAPGYSARWTKFVKKLMDEKEPLKAAAQETEKLGKAQKKAVTSQILNRVKKSFAAGMSHKWFNAKIIGLIGALVSSIPASLIALKLQKSSARAGRYTAKRELEQDPRNFIGYTEEDFEEVKDVKGKKQTFGEKVKEYALFIPTVLKQYYAYDKYKRTEFKEHQLLMDELKKSEVSEEQLRDAKNLQRKLFNTFEKVDDNSQTYSESMEAAIEILQPFALSAGVLTMMSPLIYVGIQAARGKITAAELLNKFVDKLSKASNFLKGKKFKKYLNDVAEKIPHKVGNVELQHKPLASMLAHIDFKNDTIGEVGAKIFKNIQSTSGSFRLMNNSEQVRLLDSIEKSIKNTTEYFDYQNPEITKFLNILKHLKSDKCNPRLRADMLDILINNTDVIKRMPEANFKAAMMKYADLICEAAGEDKIRNFAKHLPDLAENIGEQFPGIEDFIYKFANRYSTGAQDMTIFDLQAFKKAFVDLIDKKTCAKASEDFNNILAGTFSNEAFPYKFPDIPVKIDEIIKHVDNIGRREPKFDPTHAISGKAGANTSEAVDDTLKSIINKYSDPAEYVKTLNSKVEKMTDDEFYAMVDKAGISSMDKKTMLEILPKVEKIINNIPKDELKRIGAALAKEFKEHPDEFMKALKSGQLAAAFLTDSLVKTAAAVGISWTALNIALIWIIQTWLADIQLKAGRLGVMKAIESLEDPAYYADIEPLKAGSPDKTPDASTRSAASVENGNLLKKFQR